MATINTIQDLLHLLDENPEWVDALRARLLTPEILDLPEQLARLTAEVRELGAKVDRFVEATNQRLEALEAGQARHEERLDRLEAGQARLEAGQARHEERLDRLEAGQARLEAGQDRLEAGQAKLEAGQAKLEAGQAKLEAGQAKLEAGQARHESELKELRRDIAVIRGGHARTAAIGKVAGIARSMGLRLARTLTEDDLWDMTDSADTSGIPSNLLDSFRNADLTMEATETKEGVCYITAEVSFTVHERDVSRAVRNSRLLTRFTGRPAFAAVVGERVHSDVQDIIDSGRVFWYRLKSDDLEVE